MAEKQDHHKQRTEDPSSSGGARRTVSGRVIAAAVAVLVAGAAGIAIATSNDESTTIEASTIEGAAAPGEYQDITVDGEALAPLQNGESDAALGVVAPNVSGFSFSGLPVSVAPGTEGAPTMLVFLAHWCPHCNAEMPRLVRWYDDGQVPDDLRVVGVATSSRKDQPNWPPSAWMQKSDWPFEILADSETNDAAAAYGVSGFPFTVILDAAGKVVARHSGELGDDQIAQFVNGALGR